MVASETPTSAAIRRKGSPPLFFGAPVELLSTASTFLGRLTAPRRNRCSTLRNARRLDHAGSHCVNCVPTLQLFVPTPSRRPTPGTVRGHGPARRGWFGDVSARD